jgi:ABC-type transport system involved in cytochrome c biogenesis permease component
MRSMEIIAKLMIFLKQLPVKMGSGKVFMQMFLFVLLVLFSLPAMAQDTARTAEPEQPSPGVTD